MCKEKTITKDPVTKDTITKTFSLDKKSKSLKEVLGDGYEDEIEEIASCGFDELVTFEIKEDVKIDKYSYSIFNALFVFICGIAQITCGILLILTPYGKDMITEGVKDCITAFKAMKNREMINLEEYFVAKTISYVMIALMANAKAIGKWFKEKFSKTGSVVSNAGSKITTTGSVVSNAGSTTDIVKNTVTDQI